MNGILWNKRLDIVSLIRNIMKRKFDKYIIYFFRSSVF